MKFMEDDCSELLNLLLHMYINAVHTFNVCLDCSVLFFLRMLFFNIIRIFLCYISKDKIKFSS